jgi:outer membrane murein-binding lipoprotein Lpp
LLGTHLDVGNLLISPETVVAYCSHSTRLARKAILALCCAIVAPLLVVGCQSSAQFDQAARELRMQEDQLYAMEDYVTQYQQLLCKYRSENAALRRQLAERGITPKTAPSNDRSLVTPPSTNGPDIEVPSNSPANGPPQPSTAPTDAPDVPPLGDTTSVDSLMFRGEVVANDEGGGPRLVVDVEPRDADGRPTVHDGALSLMLVEPNDDVGPMKLGRWDYRPKDVQAATDPAGDRIRFHVELPEDTPLPKSSELWVQLLQRDGNRVVAHAALDLHQPSTFASHDDESPYQVASHDEAVMAAVYSEAGDVPPVESEVLDAGWSTAKPNEPAGIPGEGESEDWRASSEPPPEAIAMPRPHVSPQAPKRRVAKADSRKSVWSPDRAGQPSRSAARPSWSANR